MSLTQHTLRVLSRELREKENIVGLQLLNEPQDRSELLGWYSSTLDALRVIAPDLPLYMHDAWNSHKYASLAGSRADTDFIVLDHHLYRCFTPDDHRLSGDEHARTLREHTVNDLVNVANKCRGNFVVAEFSAALNPGSLRSDDPGEQDRQRRVFVRAQLDVYERACAGWFFWTYKKDGWDAGWSLKDATIATIMPDWVGMKKVPGKTILSDPASRDAAKEKAFGTLSFYTGTTIPQGNFPLFEIHAQFQLFYICFTLVAHHRREGRMGDQTSPDRMLVLILH